MLYRSLLGLLFIFSLTSIVLAKTGVVTTKDGQTFRGDVTEDDKQGVVIVKRDKIETRLNRKFVASVEYVLTFDEQFSGRLAKLAPMDVPGRIELAQYAFDNHKYDLARDTLESALKIDPTNRQASNLLDFVVRTTDLEKKSRNGTAAKPATSSPTTTATTSPVIEKKVLSAADINLVRQKEIGKDEIAYTVRFDNGVGKRFLIASGMDPAEFNQLGPVQQSTEILKLNKPDLSADVRITSDPDSIKKYRQTIQPIVLSGCATSGCHGGKEAGNFSLLGGNSTDPTSYTNFYILQTFTKSIAKSNYSIIDRATPERSLLLQFALSPDIALVQHPQASGYRPMFKTKQDPRYIQILDWIENSLNVVQPNYGIQFPLAKNPSSKTPASQPATK